MQAKISENGGGQSDHAQQFCFHRGSAESPKRLQDYGNHDGLHAVKQSGDGREMAKADVGPGKGRDHGECR